MRIITISGKAGAGKDFCALEIKKELENYGKKVLILHYADYLKYCAAQYLGWDGKKDEKGRQLLQQFGTDFVRNRDPNFWVNTVCNLIHLLKPEYDFFLIPDTRFPNEVEEINRWFPSTKACALQIIRFNEDGKEYDNPFLTDEQKHHTSETALDEYDFNYTIMNIPAHEDSLSRQIKFFVEELIDGFI